MYVPDMHYVESYYKDKSNDKTEVVGEWHFGMVCVPNKRSYSIIISKN